MSDLRQHPVDVCGHGRLPGDLDRLLQRFLCSEMPDPWPAFERPAQPILRPGPITSRGSPLRRSRLALAASLLFFVSGPLYLSHMFSGYAPVAADAQGKTEATHRSGRAIPPALKRAPATKSSSAVKPRSTREEHLTSER